MNLPETYTNLDLARRSLRECRRPARVDFYPRHMLYEMMEIALVASTAIAILALFLGIPYFA